MLKQKKVQVGWIIMTLLSLSIAGYAILSYMRFDPTKIKISIDPDFLQHELMLYVHIFSSSIALLVGPFMFMERFRNRNLSLHRWLGRIYLVLGILLGGISGLVVAQYTQAGFNGRVGFSMLSILWLSTGWMAYTNIRSKQVKKHQEWMIRNYALSFAAVTLRIWLPLGIAMLFPQLETTFDGEFDRLFQEAYSVVPWLCWVPNLIVAELIINRRRTKLMAVKKI